MIIIVTTLLFKVTSSAGVINKIVCRASTRLTHVYTSLSHVITVTLLTSPGGKDPDNVNIGKYFIKYQGI